MSNKIISDYRSEALQGTIKLVDSKGNEKICVGTKPIILSNQWKPAKVNVKKGDLISIDGKDYRVLKTDGNIAEVLAMYDASDSLVFDTNSTRTNTYEGKNIDTYCNGAFYSGLSATIQSAIVDKTFTQDSWTSPTSVPTGSHYTGKYGPSNYYLTLANAAYGSSITRHCYCLSIQDVLDYLDATTSMTTNNTTLTDTNIWQMFWNATSSQSNKYIWLRSALSTISNYVLIALGSSGYLATANVGSTSTVHPAFQIDLSKVDYAIL